MDSLTLIIIFLSFGLSFLFALGGVGSAVVLIPTLSWLGVPFNLARPTGLFVNCVSMLGATYSNFKEKRLDIRLGLPIILSSIILAFAGLAAWAGGYLGTKLMQKKMHPQTVKRLLGGILLLLGVKLLWSLVF